jgi:hypothetical protein
MAAIRFEQSEGSLNRPTVSLSAIVGLFLWNVTNAAGCRPLALAEHLGVRHFRSGNNGRHSVAT